MNNSTIDAIRDSKKHKEFGSALGMKWEIMSKLRKPDKFPEEKEDDPFEDMPEPDNMYGLRGPGKYDSLFMDLDAVDWELLEMLDWEDSWAMDRPQPINRSRRKATDRTRRDSKDQAIPDARPASRPSGSRRGSISDSEAARKMREEKDAIGQ
jgi:hypothetical protein